MNDMDQHRNETLSPFNEMVSKFVEELNRGDDLDPDGGDSVHEKDGKEGCPKGDAETTDAFGAFDEASLKMREGLSEVLSRLNKRLDKISNGEVFCRKLSCFKCAPLPSSILECDHIASDIWTFRYVRSPSFRYHPELSQGDDFRDGEADFI